MKKELIFAAALLPLAAATACNRADTDEATRRTAATMRDVASRTGDKLADAWLTTKIQAQYFADEDIKARHINVWTRDGVVTLTGRVDTEAAHEQALNIAWYTDGVTDVQDHLAVGPVRASNETESAGETDGAVATAGTTMPLPATAVGRMDDASVTAFVQSRYFLDEDIKGRRVQVDTHDGVITLRGEVASDNERAKALLLARTTPGVERVEDALTVNAALTPASGPGSTPPVQSAPPSAAQSADAALADKVQSRLSGDPQLKAGSFEVTVKDGVLLLDGTVPNAAAKQRALSVARETDGVVQVIDRLKVRRLQ
jgi:hyperosmotically inducible protein